MSTGFVLNIPDTMLEKLKETDKHISSLATKSKNTEAQVISAFRHMADNGVGYFLQQMRKANELIDKVGTKGKNMNVGAGMFADVAVQAKNAIDEVNRVVTAISKVKRASGETGMAKNPFAGMSESLKDWNALQSKIDEADQKIKKLTSTTMDYERQMQRMRSGQTTPMNISYNEYAYTKERIAALQEEKRVLQEKQAEITRQNNALSEQVRIQESLKRFVANQDSLPNRRSRDDYENLRRQLAEEEKASEKAEKKRVKDVEKSEKEAAKIREAERKKREKEEKATADRIAAYDSKARRERYKAYTTTYEGAMRTSDRAKTLLQEQQAIKNLEAARAKLNKTDSDYANKLRNLNQRILEHKNNIDKATAGSKNLQTQHRSLMDISGQLARRLALVFSVSQITGYVKKLIEVRGEFELQQRSLQAILQNKDEANRIWQQTVDLAVRSPFRVKELVSYTKQLAAYRIESDKLFETNKMLADISAGLGVDMQRLILAFGQVRSAAYLRGTELRQFTEAGIPILEQLAQYFTELEGRAVSVGDVFERVSKRMVSFADVEEIFRRMTSEGGTFYRMQEIQAETLQGQISNLKDSVDIMLNEIGKAHQDTLKSSVAFVRSIVQNWRLLATAIQQAGFALAGFSAVKIIRALRLTGDALVEATVKARGLTAATAKLKLSMMDLGKWIKAHPAFFAVGLIASATHALIQYGKSVDAMNEKYDEMSQRELRRVDTLKELNEQAEKNNQAIKDAIAEQDNASEGTDEYATAEDNLSRARGKNISLLERLKKEYPEVYASITKQEDGTVDLTKAIEEQNKVAQRQIALQQQAKGGWFQESLTKNYEDAVEALGNYQSSLDKVAVATYEMRQNLSMALSSEQITQEEYDAISNIADRMMDIKDSVEGLNLIEEIFGTKAMSNAEISALVEPIRHALVELGETVPEYNWALGDFFDNLENLKSLPVTINEMVALDPEKGKENAGDYVESVLDEFGIVNDTIREWAKRKIEKIIGFKLVWGDGEGDGVGELTEDWAKRVDAAIKDINDKVKRDSKNISDADLFPRPKAGQTKEAYLALAKEVIGIAEMTYNETQQIEDESMVNRTKALSPYADEVKKILNLFKDNNKGKDDEAVKILNKRIGLIKEMYSEYQKGEKVIGGAAEKQVSDAYAKTFKEAFEDTGINLTGLVIDKDKLTELQNAGNEAGEVFSEAMLTKMNEVAEAGTYIRNVSDKVKDQIKLDEGFVGYIYDDAEQAKVKTQIKTLEELYKYFDKATGKAKEVEGQGTLTIGYGHALQTLEEAKKYLGITLEQSKAEELLNEDIKDRVAPLNKLLDTYNELIVTQEQYDTLFNNFYQGGLSRALRMAFSDSTSELEGYIKGLDEDLSSWGSSFAQEWGDNWLEEFKQLETKAERFAKVLEIASVTTVASGSHIDKNLFYGENAMKARSARRAAEFRGDLEVVKLLEKAAVDVSQIDFTNIEGVVAILERLRPIAKKEGEEAVNTLNQAISKFKAEIGFTAKKNADKELLAQVQQLFDQYDLSLELKKLNIPPDLAKSLFDVDYLDLEGLKKAVQDQEAKFIGTDMEDEYKKFLDKIDDMEDKAAKERMKTYVEYARSAIGERAKIKLEELKKLKEIEETFAEKEGDSEETKKYKREQKQLASEKAQKESSDAMQKLEWEDFQKSDMFINIFEDLDGASDALLNHMIQKLQEFKNEWTDMPLEDMKKIVDKINELQMALVENNPWEAYKKSKEAVKDAMKGATFESEDAKTTFGDGKSQSSFMQALQLENVYQEQKKLNAQEELGYLETALRIKEGQATEEEKILERQEDYNKYLRMSPSELKKQISAQKTIVKNAEDILSANEETLTESQKQAKALLKQADNLGKAQQMANDLYDAFSGLAEALGADSDSPAAIFADMGMNMLNTVLNTIQLQIQLNAATIAANGLGIAMNTAMGVVGWIVMAIQLVVQAITAIVNYADKQKEKEIERLAKRVEDLKEKFEDLSEAIDEAWSTSQLTTYKDELDQTYKMAIAAQKAIVAARADEKKVRNGKTDSEEYKQWEEAKKELEELEQEYAESIQNIYSKVTDGILDSVHDAAREFTDAWWDAFIETGDGLSGLEENFNEMFLNLAKNQAAMQITGAFAERWKKDLEKYINADDTELTKDEAKKWAEEVRRTMPELSEALEGYLGAFKDMATAEGAGLSGLQKGIQGVSESTAQVLESLLSSMRFYVADSNSKLGLLLQSMGVSTIENPQLVELRTQTMVLNEINAKIASLNETVGGLIVNDRLKVTATTQLDQLIRPRANGGVGLNIVND